MIRIITFAAACFAIQPGLASPQNYCAAANYTDRLSGTKVRYEETGITNPVRGYIDGARGTFQSRERVGGEVMNDVAPRRSHQPHELIS